MANPPPEMQGTSVEAIEAREAFSRGDILMEGCQHGGLDIDLRAFRKDIWLSFRRNRSGGVALRTPLLADRSECRLRKGTDGTILNWEAVNEAGRLIGELQGDQTGLENFSYRVTFTPSLDLHIPYFPRDLIVFGRYGNPCNSAGTIEACQRRLNTGLCYLKLMKPAIGKLLYVQNLTALNDYFGATGTKPENAVGGEWPVLGYLPPTRPNEPTQTLPAGKSIVIYDTRLVFRHKPEEEETESAWQFLDMLGAIYRNLDKPETQRRDWVDRSRQTLRDLKASPKARVRHHGETYFRPYTAAENPDSMVELSLLSAIHDWGEWEGKKEPLEARALRGLEKFYDPELKALRRYLPDASAGKNPDTVDSWYLYHPLLNLSNLALAGNERAKGLFLRSVDYGIRAAQHFNYKWPIEYDIKDFSIITPVTPADRRGQTDVGGVYAWVMLQAFELTLDSRFIDEARNALDAGRGMRFDLNYQANLTAWGAAACIRLWRITNRKTYLGLSYVYLASFFHNAQIWESEIGHARHYSNFLSVTCLQDAPYTALYECFDSYAAFERFLDLGGPDLIPAAKMLVTEYCRYALDRAWYYYPDALPADALADDVRNGEIDPKLSFPLEDLYPDGQPAGQVGQEIYGAGAAMIFATRAYHPVRDAPFVIFCDHFLRAGTRLDGNVVSIKIDGEATHLAELAFLRKGRNPLPEFTVRTLSDQIMKPYRSTAEQVCYKVPASGLVLSWE